MSFSQPLFLLIAALLALVVVGFALAAHSRPGVGVRVVGQHPLLLGLGVAMMLTGVGLGVAKPRYGLPEIPRLTVHVVLDASRSMRVRDVRVKDVRVRDMGARSRWEAALRVLDRMWDEPGQGIRYSLDLLTGDSIPLLPAGEDRALLRDVLRAVTPGDLGSPGTSFGRGLPQLKSQIDENAPAAVLFLGDGEESLESPDAALSRALAFLKEHHLPFYAVCLGGEDPSEIPLLPGERNARLRSQAQPAFLKRLAEGSGGRAFTSEEDLAAFFQKLATGKEAMPLKRSLKPAHPEVGAWLALIGLGLWLFAAGKPMRSWRTILCLPFFLAAGGAQAAIPLPESVKAWLAQAAIDKGDLEGARAYVLAGEKPMHRLLKAQIELKSRQPAKALEALKPLTGQGSPRPLPEWRAPALLLAAKAHLDLDQRQEAKDLLERVLREEPGRKEAVHNLQALTKDLAPPPPPKRPPPPPPPRPSQGARQDELEGIRQRLPVKPMGGVKDI